MKVIIQGKQMRLSPGLKRYAEEHVVQPLRRFYDNEAALGRGPSRSSRRSSTSSAASMWPATG